MKTLITTTALLLLSAAIAAASPHLQPLLSVTLEGLDDKGHIKPEYAFCAPAATGHMQNGGNKSPGISWEKGPEGTKSYAIIAVDPDVPTVFDDAGKEGKPLPASMPRRNFYHWVLVNIPATTTSLAEGLDSKEVSPTGKSELQMPYGLRGVNDYAPYMASNPEHKGVYAGYDGPCPPWNDEAVHHYHFGVFALDIATLPATEALRGEDAIKAMQGHILASGEAVGLYTLNPALDK